MNGDGVSLVRNAVDIVQLVGQSVKLTRRGKDYVGLCPFHQEKSPSFSVSPSKQMFYCYGCKAGGTVFDFVMKRDRIEFRDALEVLARSAGIELPRSGQNQQKAGERQQLLDACAAAVSFFDKCLQQPAGQAAREYLEQRGFTPETLRKFSVGFALDSWDALLTALSRKFPQQILLAAGLIKQRDGGSGCYDTFRHRVMFPIRDETGRTIAFGGRIMPGADDRTAKYLNSPETPLFHKSRAIFGLDLAKQRIVETKTVAVVEGYTDVVMAHQYGATNVVSILGTAMTEQHVSLLRRFADRIVLLFDADRAGEAAVNRTVELFLTQPIEIAVASIPQGLDPDEFLLRDGLDAFNALLTTADDALTFKWKLMQEQFKSAGGLTGEQKAVTAYLEVLGAARGAGPVDNIRWGAALNRVAKLVNVPIDELNRRFRASPPPRRRAAVTEVAQIAEYDESNGIVDTAAGPSAQETAEKQLLACLLLQPDRWIDVQREVQPSDFVDDRRRELAEAFWEVSRHDGEPELAQFITDLPNESVRQLAVELANEWDERIDIEQAVSGAVGQFRESRSRRGEAGHLSQTAQGTEAEQVAALIKLQARPKHDPRRLGPTPGGF